MISMLSCNMCDAKLSGEMIDTKYKYSKKVFYIFRWTQEIYYKETVCPSCGALNILKTKGKNVHYAIRYIAAR